MPGDFGKNAKSMLQAKTKVTVLWFVKYKLKVLKARNKFRHTLLL
jgi:hypothetical protein